MTLTRRSLIASSLAAIGAAALPAPALALTTPEVGLTCLHTGRNCAFRYDGSLSPAEVRAFRSVTRDWRAGLLFDMDLELVDLLSKITRKSGSETGYGLISGYRSPQTNRALSGTATRSLHMKGMALDIRRTDLKLRDLRDIARSLKVGGVGYYPQARNRFVHVDTGRVRYW